MPLNPPLVTRVATPTTRPVTSIVGTTAPVTRPVALIARAAAPIARLPTPTA